jgi:predicted Ser/Thr protein kinase
MDWLTANYVQIVNVVTAVIAAASAISALTPSDADNKLVAKIKGLVDFFALNVLNAKTK